MNKNILPTKKSFQKELLNILNVWNLRFY
jgi:hypothetical protein